MAVVNKVPVKIYVSLEQAARLREIAAVEQRSMTSVARQLVENGLRVHAALEAKR